MSLPVVDEDRFRYPEDVLEMQAKTTRPPRHSSSLSSHDEVTKRHPVKPARHSSSLSSHDEVTKRHPVKPARLSSTISSHDEATKHHPAKLSFRHYPEHRLRDGERILAFTDAAVAIAITLLVLPLMESAAHLWRVEKKSASATHIGKRGLSGGVAEVSSVTEGAASLIYEEESSEDEEIYTSVNWFQDHKHDVLLFVTSFAVIFVFWSTHERLFRHVRGMTRFLSFLNFCWLLGIAWMPVSMEVNRAAFSVADHDDLVHLQYFGTLLFLQTLAILQTIEVIRNPQTWYEESNGPRWKHLVQNGVDFVFICIAMGFSASPVGYWGMDLLMLTYPVTDVICSKWPHLKGHVGDTVKVSKSTPKETPIATSEEGDDSW